MEIRPRFPLFDGLRGVACACVLFAHVPLLWFGGLRGDLLDSVFVLVGVAGVCIFFVISGFLLYRPYVAARLGGTAPPSTRDFAIRRVLRIIPAYWAALVLLGVFPGLVGVWGDNLPLFFGFLQIYDLDTAGQGIPVAWTLCAEVAFYALLPLAAAGLRRVTPAGTVARELWLLALVAAASTVFRSAALHDYESRHLALSLGGTALWLTAGMALAAISAQREHRGRGAPRLALRPGLCWGVAAVGVGMTIAIDRLGSEFADTRGVDVTRHALMYVTGGVVGVAATLPAVFGPAAAGGVRQLLATRPVVALGVMAYPVYLVHYPLYEKGAGWLVLHDTPGGFLIYVAAASAGVLAISYMLHRFVELPGIALGRRLAGRARRARAATEPV